MTTRNPAVAGAFYPSDGQELSELIDFLLKAHAERKQAQLLENVHGLVVPHAGYAYSGKTAGAAYRKIIGKKFSKAIILCPNHTLFLDKIAFDISSCWKTPLGEVKVDNETCLKLGGGVFIPNSSSHIKEHAIEVQVPFLQKTLQNFKLIPLVVGTIKEKEIKFAAHEILKIMDHETLLVISTDLSHFHSEREAEHIDSSTIKNILSLNSNSELDACGSYSLKVFEEICRIKKWTPKLIEYTNSGKITGDHSRVVGYASFWF